MGNRIDINGLNTYYEEYGKGEPLLLLHGGFGSGDSLKPVGQELAKHFRVIAPDRRGHGQTADFGPISYDLMADDTIALIEKMGLGKAHIVGYSDGGILCLLIALKRPDLVAKMVPISANFHHEGVPSQMKQMFSGVTPEVLKMMIPDAVTYYEQNSPDGAEQFPVVFEKIKKMILTEPELKAEDLSKITAPTLVIAADRDLMTIEHSVAIFTAIPNAQLCIVPGTNHGLVFERTAEVNAAALRFLLGTGAPESH